MQLPSIKKIIKNTKITILAFTIVSTMTGCAFQFGRGDLNENVSEKSVEDLTTKINVVINESDWTDNSNIEESINQVVENAKQFAEKEDALSDFQKVSIVRVVDGDTIVVDVEADGCGSKEHSMTVRLIGIDTPESVASQEYLERTGKENSEAGMKASDYTKLLLNNIEYVYLEKDFSDTDKYNRLLRYVWIEIPTNDMDLQEIANEMLNGILVRDHVANVATYIPDTKYSEDFEMIYNMDYDSF